MPVFGNPLGLLALLGIPVVLAIHFLQRKAKELPISTLFLLEHTRREAISGRRLERLIPSIPLWMQLLAILILAWFLSEPRYQRAGSVQRIAIVMDSSASMEVFKMDAVHRLEMMISKLQASASEVEIIALEAVPERPRIFAGSSIAELKKSLMTWQPQDGPVDATQSLRLARSLVSQAGTVIHVTDTPTGPLPFDALQLSVGEVIENVGFTGVSFANEEGRLIWRALVRNYSPREVERSWTVHTDEGHSTPRPIRIAPHAMMTLQGAFPDRSEHVRLTLSGDRFSMDDVMPLVAPINKPIAILDTVSTAYKQLSSKLVDTLESAQMTSDPSAADLTIACISPTSTSEPTGNAVLFAQSDDKGSEWLKGAIVAEKHSLMTGLNWQSLLTRESKSLTPSESDTILLWQDKRPLIFLRESANKRQLWFNFDPISSNAEKQPAFILLLHRFAESIRETKIASVSMNLETGQTLSIAQAPGIPLVVKSVDPTGAPIPMTGGNPSGSNPKSQPRPGFMTVTQGDQLLMKAAVHFGDSRESDFSNCASAQAGSAISKASIARHTRPDPLWRIWVLMLIAALLISWSFASKLSIPA